MALRQTKNTSNSRMSLSPLTDRSKETDERRQHSGLKLAINRHVCVDVAANAESVKEDIIFGRVLELFYKIFLFFR
jgi:hypothetical protein